ncbi:uncharacterized protein LOC125236264 [Leguminivora glycinivorella]|uniref:uncharacterized protein LOC125236264 n=1 Tax=Leguminivora glycinivorella TaxID=1035111 RepID=UPI002010435A|nr:uncharacterized protein LOC125236264 [Leguminivora glycinivorella]
MELMLFVITFLWSLKMSSSIRCYNCEVEHTTAYNKAAKTFQATQTCDHFNGSDVSAVECPESTMCVKRVTTQDIGPDLSSRSVRRGCAPQTTEGMQEKVGRHWVPVNKIYEVYEEGCIDDPSNEHKLTKTVLCYCRGDLCNSSGRLSVPATLLITGTMLLFRSCT